mmetsp:Transcript_27601/g.46684  ORF Transcript_27601/g.46684 Transcript_27601/m.46684 type:complete len:341 (+) Transcript_27601:92-1114(+)
MNGVSHDRVTTSHEDCGTIITATHVEPKKKKSSSKKRPRDCPEAATAMLTTATAPNPGSSLSHKLIEGELIHWVQERQSIYIKKEIKKEEKPWTTDPVLLNYRFCNVRRDNDRVTKWLFQKWYEPNSSSPHLAFSACVARHFNWPDTLTDIGFPHEWEPDKVRKILKHRRDVQKVKVYTGAYIVPPPSEKGADKIDYSIDAVLTPLFEKLTCPTPGTPLQDFWVTLQSFRGLGSFLAGQVVADLKYFGCFKDSPDWDSFAPLGPGSIRGLNRFHQRPVKTMVKQRTGLVELQDIQRLLLAETGMQLPVHDVQNCMCEFDKYMRVKYEGGRLRARYSGHCS